MTDSLESKTYRIYLADDDKDDRQLFKEALEESDLDIFFLPFANGKSLMENLLNTREDLPDFIFLDLNMPLMDGKECLQEIRDIAAFAQIPVIIYSSSIEHMRAAHLHELGADLYLRKPNTFPKLKIAINKCIDYLEGNSSHEDRSSDFILQL